MKTRYEFIHFEKIGSFAKTSVWVCRNKKTDGQLGVVQWYPGWRQYCYFQSCEAVYSAGCLADIAAFISQLKSGDREE